jgi:Fe-S cluster biogenesis protein NfuA
MTPEAAPAPTSPASVTERVKAAMERIRPAVQMDGGDIQLVDVDEANGIVRVALAGACVGCSMSALTLAFGVERTLRDLVPEVKEVHQI